MWSIITGAAELAMGDTVQGFKRQPGSQSSAAFAIFTRNRTSILYGSSVADWNLVPYREELGAYAYTIQDLGRTMFLDDRGVMVLETAQEFGNFAHAAVTNQVLSFVNTYRTLAVASCISRERSQYRLFFSNGRALYITVVGPKIVGIMPVAFPNAVTCICSREDSSGAEQIYFGSDNGMVYQLDKGTSFDGTEIDFYIDLSYNFCRSPRVEKDFWDLTLEVEGSGYAGFSLGYSLGYGLPEIPQPSAQAVTMNFTPTFWDQFVWDQFQWDGITLAPVTIDMDGRGENYSLAVRGASDYLLPFSLSGAVTHYTRRAVMRP